LKGCPVHGTLIKKEHEYLAENPASPTSSTQCQETLFSKKSSLRQLPCTARMYNISSLFANKRLRKNNFRQNDLYRSH
jgi:hypothetical protein